LALNEVKTILKSSGQSYKDGSAKTPAFSIEEQYLADVKMKPSKTISSNSSKDSPAKNPELLAIIANLGRVASDQKDNLKKLSGLGVSTEKKLNEIGVFTFAQIAKIDTTANLSLLTTYLGSAGNKANLLAWKIEAEEKLKNDNN
jgi:molybdopterin-containing oxidoreductase family membrane subunit